MQRSLRFLIALGIAGCGGLLAQADAAKAAPTDQQMIASAMSAGPASMVRDATIIAAGADGTMRTLRKGTNEWTCMPDDPGSPGNDPMCMDANGLEWAQAWMAHKNPSDKVGFIYMLQGGSDASNTDPYASKPSKGMRWVTTGPHVMVVGPAAKSMVGYIKGSNPDTSKPYVMWGGTAYEHLMIPVK